MKVEPGRDVVRHGRRERGHWSLRTRGLASKLGEILRPFICWTASYGLDFDQGKDVKVDIISQQHLGGKRIKFGISVPEYMQRNTSKTAGASRRGQRAEPPGGERPHQDQSEDAGLILPLALRSKREAATPGDKIIDRMELHWHFD